MHPNSLQLNQEFPDVSAVRFLRQYGRREKPDRLFRRAILAMFSSDGRLSFQRNPDSYTKCNRHGFLV
jgi:hypothetical protein